MNAYYDKFKALYKGELYKKSEYLVKKKIGYLKLKSNKTIIPTNLDLYSDFDINLIVTNQELNDDYNFNIFEKN